MKIYMIYKMVYFIVVMLPLLLILMSTKMFYMKINFYHPMNQMIMLIFLIMLFSIYIYLLKENSIYSLLLLITYISGILVVFSYFTALINKPLFIFNYFSFMVYMITVMTLLNTIMLIVNYKYQYFIFYTLNYISLSPIYEVFVISKIYIYFMLVIMLMLILFMSIKICSKKNMPLRSKMNEKL